MGYLRGSRPPQFGMGFTLIETLVVVSIIGILAILLISPARRLIDNAGRAKSLSNLRQLAMAHTTYMGEHEGEFAFYAKYTGFYGSDYLWQLLFPYVGENTEVFRSPGDKRKVVALDYTQTEFLPGTSAQTKEKLKGPCSFGSNDYITGGRGFFGANNGITRLQQIVDVPLSKIVLFFDSNLDFNGYRTIGRGGGSYTFNRDWPNPAVDRHGGGASFVFLDGHGAWLPTGKAPAEWKTDFMDATFLPFKN